MDSQNKNAIDLCDKVIEYVPEFKEYKDFSLWGKENPYLHFGNFGNFLAEKIENSSGPDPIMNRAFGFINDTYNNLNDQYVRTMLRVDILENLTISKKTIEVASNHLKGNALFDFHNHYVK